MEENLEVGIGWRVKGFLPLSWRISLIAHKVVVLRLPIRTEGNRVNGVCRLKDQVLVGRCKWSGFGTGAKTEAPRCRTGKVMMLFCVSHPI